jgi:hypothetical protein
MIARFGRAHSLVCVAAQHARMTAALSTAKPLKLKNDNQIIE